MDGAFFAAHRSAGVGVLIWDDYGRVVRACSKKLLAPFGALEAEAKAIEFGMQFAKDLLI